MVKCSSINYYKKNISGALYALLILIFVIVFCPLAKAQPYFNRLYTNNATASIFSSICPQNNKGNFMGAAVVIDSIEKVQGIRVSRFDSEGSIKASSFFTIPEHADRDMFISRGGIARVHDNCFAVCGTVLKRGYFQYGYIAMTDSNGLVYKYINLQIEYSPAYDSILWLGQLKYDGKDLVVITDYYTWDAANLTQVLRKYDTALNQIWAKPLNIGSYSRRRVYDLVVDNSGYIVSGGTDNALYPYKTYRSEALIFKTDTGGNVKWTYKSPSMMSAATDIIQTRDKGYVFVTMGNVYDKRAGDGSPDAWWHSQELITKLDSDGKWQWQKQYDNKYYPNLDLTPIRLLDQPDNSFFTMHLWVDSPGLYTNIAYATIRHYSDTGKIIWEHRYQEPIDTPVYATVGLNDITHTDDKSIIMAGYVYNLKSTGTPPGQRGWLIKLDSNGCMSVDDPQCDPVSILEAPKSIKGYKIYPNPSNGTIIISAPQPQKQILVNVYDLLGRVVVQQELSFSNQQSILQTHLSDGVYILELSDEQGQSLWETIVIRE